MVRITSTLNSAPGNSRTSAGDRLHVAGADVPSSGRAEGVPSAPGFEHDAHRRPPDPGRPLSRLLRSSAMRLILVKRNEPRVQPRERLRTRLTWQEMQARLCLTAPAQLNTVTGTSLARTCYARSWDARLPTPYSRDERRYRSRRHVHSTDCGDTLSDGRIGTGSQDWTTTHRTAALSWFTRCDAGRCQQRHLARFHPAY